MEKYKPYHIVHIDIAGLQDIVLEPGKYYLVFYHNTIPLGHLFRKIDQNLQEHYTAIFDAISTALLHYATQLNISINPDIKEDFIRKDLAPLIELLDRVCHKPVVLERNTISVVICTRNRPEAVANCIEAVLNSKDKEFELIVVDNAPENELTKLTVQRFPNVKYILEPKKGLDIARNTGAKHASGSVIAFTDDDVLVPGDWIENLKTCFNDPVTMAVTGLVLPLSLQSESQYVFEKNWGFNKGYIPKVFDHHYFKRHLRHGMPVWEIGAGANMAFRANAFQFAGGFDERLDVGASGCSGDSEMWYRIIAEGWTCRYFPHLLVHHQHRTTMGDLRKQLFAYMRGHVSSILVQYEKYRHLGNLRRIYLAIPKYYLNKTWDTIKTGKINELSGIFNEISGTLSGWWFYQRNKRPAQPRRPFTSLHEPQEFREGDLVSVVIPCYNHAQYLPQAIKSVLNQTYLHMEVIVVDDGSTDKTKEVCDAYPAVRYLHMERSGLSAARNQGVKVCRGRYVIFLDADDFLTLNAVSIHGIQLKNYPSAVFISGAHQRIDIQGNPISGIKMVSKAGYCFDALLQGNYIAMEGAVMYRRELFHAFVFDTNLDACEDYDLNLRITRNFPTFTHTDIVAIYRIHTQNMSSNTKIMLQQALRVLNKQVPFLKTDLEKESHAKGVQNWQLYYSPKISG